MLGTKGASRFFIWALIFIAIAALIEIYFFVPRPSGVDELGLFNPVYMKLHYGRMTYPVHYYPESMVVHPPLRYAEVAALMAAGMNLFYAEGFGITFFSILVLIIIGTGGFRTPVKTGLLFGFLAGLLLLANWLDGSIAGLRPDLQLAVAWFAGLLMLEDGCLRHWDSKRLALGAFLVAYASGLHYFAIPALLAVVPYLLQAWRREPRRDFKRVLASIAFGGCAFGIPYLILFVVPEFAAILQITSQVQEAGNALTPFVKHFDLYRYWLGRESFFHAGLSPFEFAYPALLLRLPLFVAGGALLAFRRDTRRMAWAALPLCLFVFAYSRGKSAGYFLPEILIYFSGVGIALSEACLWLARLVSARHAESGATAAITLLTLVTLSTHNEPLSRIEHRPNISTPEMDVARAAAKEVVGPNALVGGRVGLWYVSGATHWYNIESDLLWRPDISDLNLSEYFAKFDFIAEHGHMSNTTINKQLESLPSWYVSGDLRLGGFFLSESHPNLSFLLFRPTAARQVTGFVSHPPTLARFEESTDGDRVFLTMVCGFEQWPGVNRFGLKGFNALFLPKASADSPERSFLPQAAPNDPQQAVVMGMLPLTEFNSRQDSFSHECRILDVVAGKSESVDVDGLLSRFYRTDQTIQFYRTIDEAADYRAAKEPAAVQAPNLNRLQQAYAKASIRQGSPVEVTTGPEPWSFAAFLPIDLRALPDDQAWVSVKAKVESGKVGLGIYDQDSNAYLARKFVGPGDTFRPILLPITKHNEADGLMIENGSENQAPSTIAIDSVEVLVPSVAHGRMREPPGGK